MNYSRYGIHPQKFHLYDNSASSVQRSDNFDEYGIDYNGPVPSTNDEMQNTVTVPDVDVDLSEDNIAELSRRVCPTDPSTVHGLDHFVSAKQFVCQILAQGRHQ